jgi:hypothetical protein
MLMAMVFLVIFLLGLFILSSQGNQCRNTLRTYQKIIIIFFLPYHYYISCRLYCSFFQLRQSLVGGCFVLMCC